MAPAASVVRKEKLIVGSVAHELRRRGPSKLVEINKKLYFFHLWHHQLFLVGEWIDDVKHGLRRELIDIEQASFGHL